MATPQQKTAGGIAVALALLLGIIVVANQPTPTPDPATTTTRSSSPSSSATTTAPPATSVVRWGLDTATWNQPAATFGRSTTLAPYADRWWQYAGGTAPPGQVKVAFGDYSVPVYAASTATTSARVFQASAMEKLYSFGIATAATIPWNPGWKPGTGNDNLMLVVDERTGATWSLNGVGQLPINCLSLGNVAAANSTPSTGTDLCLWSVRTYNVTTMTDGTIKDRGMGEPKAALLTRAAEVKTGTIRHALEMTITNTMFGQPACAPVEGFTAPGAGVSCGNYVKPATQLERTNPDVGCATQLVTDAERSKTIPEGMRFALQISDAEIDSWLDSRHYTGPLRSTARTFAVALRDYGWIIAETGCFGSSIEVDGLVNPSSAAVWKDLGVTPVAGTGYPFGDLVAGLITRQRVYVVEPPR